MTRGRWLPVPVSDLSPGGRFHPRRLGEPACLGFAWLDLVAQAAWEDTDDLRRGELRASVRFLAERWGWSKSRVQRFLERLEGEKSISRAGHERANKAGREPGRIMINEYDTYTRRRDTERDTKRDTNEDEVVEVRSNVETTSSVSSNVAQVVRTVNEIRSQFGLTALRGGDKTGRGYVSARIREYGSETVERVARYAPSDSWIKKDGPKLTLAAIFSPKSFPQLLDRMENRGNRVGVDDSWATTRAEVEALRSGISHE